MRQKYNSDEERKAARVASTLRSRRKRGKEEYNAYMRSYSQKRYPELRKEVHTVLGDKCNICGYDEDFRALQIDHPKGNGRQERRRIGWYKFYNKVLENPEMYQLLCANCNQIKRYTNNEVYFVDERLKGD